jgi:ribonuclease PH
MLERSYNRKSEEIRPVKFTTNFTRYAHGSVLVECGETKIIVTAFVEDRVPRFLAETGRGWLTAEYSMIPGATHSRSQRERNNKIGGRTMEIQRLIGRSLRAAIDFDDLGERTITIDCDVIQADGGTRTACINGGFVAVYDALRKLFDSGVLKNVPIKEHVGAISAGIVKNEELLDLDYSEDSSADVDSNIVMTESEKIIEFQCTSEGEPIDDISMISLLQLGKKGIQEIITLQKQALGLKLEV